MKRVIKIALLVIAALALIITTLELTSSYKVTKTIRTDAPVVTRQQITIAAPVETVWQLFADVNNWPEWQKEIPSSKLNGPFKAGSSFDWKTHGLTIHSTFHTVDVNGEIGWSGDAFGSFAIHNWYFIRQGGHTVVKVEESMEGWLVGLLKGQFQQTNSGSLDYWLKVLKSAAEERSRANAALPEALLP